MDGFWIVKLSREPPAYNVRQYIFPQPQMTFSGNRNLVSSNLKQSIGHSGLQSHFYGLKLEDSPNCNCGMSETVEHVILHYPQYYSHRIFLK